MYEIIVYNISYWNWPVSYRMNGYHTQSSSTHFMITLRKQCQKFVKRTLINGKRPYEKNERKSTKT